MEHSIYGYLIFYLVFSALTGSIMYGAWLLIEKALRKYLSARFSVVALEICLICFLVPVIYARNLYLYYNYGFDIEVAVFHISESLDIVFRILAILWLGGFFITSLIYLFTWIRAEIRLRLDSMPVTDDAALRVLEECRERTGVRRRVRLFSYVEEGTALVYGLRNVRIVVSKEDFQNMASLRIVLLHELTHISRRDILLKHICVWVRCLYWFHPLAHLIGKRLSDYLEYRCDELCCSREYGGVSRGAYFNVILKFAVLKKKHAFFVYAGFAMSKKQVKRRMDYMKEKKKLSGMKKLCVLLAVILAANASLITAYAASDRLADNHYVVNDATIQQKDIGATDLKERSTGFEVIDENVDEDDRDITEIDITDEVMKNRSTTFSVTLPSECRKTVQLYMVKGDVLTISAVIDPSTKTARAGMIRPNNTRSYVSGKGSIYGKFTAATSDYHKLYVENPNTSGTIKMMVNYYVQ